MPISDPSAPQGICSACSESASLMGLFIPVGNPELQICFACLWVHALKGAACANCGAAECAAMAAYQNTGDGPIVPVALCPNCLPEKLSAESFMVSLEDGRTPVPNISGEQ